MPFDHITSPTMAADSSVPSDIQTEPELNRSPAYIVQARRLLAELRHLLENGCDVITALDLLAEAELVLINEVSSGAQQSHANGKPEILNLSRLLDEALSMAKRELQRAGITILHRKSPPRFVRAVEAELRNILNDLIECAAGGCGPELSSRLLRFSIRNNRAGFPNLILEYGGTWTDDCELLARRSAGIEISFQPNRHVVTLTFIDRP